MEIEKKLAQTNLNQFKEVPMRVFAKACIEYQDFKTSAALMKFNWFGKSRMTCQTYFNAGVTYIKTGKCLNRILPKELKLYIDEFIAKGSYKALIPNENEKRGEFPKRKKHIEKFEVPIRRKISQPKAIIQSFLYGVKIANMLLTFNSEKEVNAFEQGYKLTNPNVNIQKVHINVDAISEVENESCNKIAR